MGLGNTNEYGNGARSNFNWQYRMLKSLKILMGSDGTGNVTPSVQEAVADGSTVASRGVTLWFRGTGGSLGGVAVPDNAIFSFNPNSAMGTVQPIAFTVPTAGEARVIISYVS